MIYYVLLIAIIIILYLVLSVLKIKNGQKKFLNISFLILFLFLALRAETTGTDLLNYKIFFNYSHSISLTRLTKLIEPGYALYSFLIYKLTNGNFQIMLIITAFISLIGPYCFIKNNSKNYFLSVIVYICLNYYLFTFSGLRQSIALSISLLSINYIKNQKIFKYLIFSFIAFCFHKSSIVFIPVYFLNKLNIKKKHLPFLIIIMLGVYIFRYNLITIFTSIMYENYATFENANGGYKLLICYLVIFIFITIFKDKVLNINKDNNLFYNMFFIGIILQIFSTVEGNGYRAALYYVMPLIVIIPSLSFCFDKESRKIVNILTTIILITYYFLEINSSSLVSNYSFFWK